jgi:hypothetical protein
MRVDEWSVMGQSVSARGGLLCNVCMYCLEDRYHDAFASKY